jgi:hypothetical protein
MQFVDFRVVSSRRGKAVFFSSSLVGMEVMPRVQRSMLDGTRSLGKMQAIFILEVSLMKALSCVLRPHFIASALPRLSACSRPVFPKSSNEPAMSHPTVATETERHPQLPHTTHSSCTVNTPGGVCAAWKRTQSQEVA